MLYRCAHKWTVFLYDENRMILLGPLIVGMFWHVQQSGRRDELRSISQIERGLHDVNIAVAVAVSSGASIRSLFCNFPVGD
jgi:hypothetical protein